MTETILPCPFCGGACHATDENGFWEVVCGACDINGAYSHFRDAAIATHNRIASAAARAEAAEARVRELEKAFDDIEEHRQAAALRVRKLEAELGRMRVALACQDALDALREVAHLSDQWHAIIKPWRERILDSPKAMEMFVGCHLYPGWEAEGLRRLAPVLRRAALAATAPKEADRG